MRWANSPRYPVVVQVVNAANRTALRKGMDSVLGIHKDRVLPEYDSAKFRSTAKPDSSFPVRDGKLTPGKVAIFRPATSITTSPASATTC
jgi:glycerol-3-phosphate dehydrogenase subunit C